jgi:hypothetical protein
MIVLWVILESSSFIVFAGLFCLLNCLVGVGTLLQNFDLTRKINNKKK